ncbi:hypothetical protein [Inquilinus limosus]|uniref:Uncharacterized protein n=1 Tax=Inquilinus limosus TaxID=171674 RepID=A0A211ZUM6_9PROT|nr:hypothetical protein [Inquilinus limosus]OWJ68914.1 hypothetical protein BWR60_02225 [Inquilinus limosus]
MNKALLLVPLLGAVVLGGVFGADVMIGQAAEKRNQPAAAAAPAAPVEAAKQDPATAQQAVASIFEDHAREGKIGACKSVFTTLGRGVVADETYTAKTQWNTKAADAHAVASLVALDGTADSQGQRGAGVVFAAPVGRSCEGTLVRVTPVKAPCQAVSAELVNQRGQAGSLGDLPTVAMPNGAQVVLVPLDQSCVAMTSLSIGG